MFERYDEAARKALFWARYAVFDVGGTSIEPEHLLLGLLRARGGIGASILGAAGLVRRAVREQLPGSTQAAPLETDVEIPFSASCTRVLTFAQSEADQMSAREITTGHLLLGLLREEKTVAFRRAGRTRRWLAYRLDAEALGGVAAVRSHIRTRRAIRGGR